MSDTNLDVKKVGKLLQEMDKTVTNVLWKIPNFAKKLLDPPLTYYESPTFAFMDIFWYLKIYPNGEGKERSEGHCGLYLCCRGKHDSAVIYTMSIRNAKGVAEFSGITEYKFDRLGMGFGYRQFCPKLTLVNRKSELLPNDTLTVQCIIQSDRSLPNGVPWFERLYNLGNDLKDILLEERDSDITLKAGECSIKAHKLILANRCKVFHSMLSHDMLESNTGIITIDDIEADVLKDMLTYIYTGDVELTTENMRELYIAADKYQLQELKKMCALFMKENISITQFCEFVRIADACKDSELMQSLREFFRKNFTSIAATEEWKAFEENNFAVTYQLLFSTLEEVIKS